MVKPKAQVLTAKAIEAFKPDPDSGAYRVSDLRCKGLALRVAVNGGKTWDLGYRIKGEGVRRRSLGKYDDVGLEAARDRADEITKAARKGVDLIAGEAAKRDEHKQSYTVERLIGEYLKRRVTGRLRTARKLEQTLNRELAPLMARKASDIRRRDLREILDAMAERGLERAAGKGRQIIGAMFRWAVSQDIVETNPADGLSSYSLGKPRDRVLSGEEVRALWLWLDDSRNISTGIGAILKLQLCLGARVSEVAGMRAAEFAEDSKGRMLWTLPAERAKNKSARVTPILGLAAEILSVRSEGALFESESGRPHHCGSVGQQLLMRRDKLPIDKFTSHDLRRTVSSLMVEIGIGLEIVAAILGHEAGDASVRTLTRHYVRSDLLEIKTAGLAQWDGRLRAILAGDGDMAGEAVVIPIGGLF